MLLRAVDFVANLGGGVRFVTEMARALLATHPDLRIELVSEGAAADRYRASLRGLPRHVPVVRASRGRPRLFGLPGTERLTDRVLGRGAAPHVDVAPEVLQDADVVWFPWTHFHRIPFVGSSRVVGSLHDVILLQFPEVAPHLVDDERETMKRWLASDATLAVSSNATVRALGDVLGAAPTRVEVVPLGGDHAPSRADAASPPRYDFLDAPFLLSPVNTSPHKNHEVLLRGVARWGRRMPLVLTGAGTTLRGAAGSRDERLGALADELGFVRGASLRPLGYVGDGPYWSLLEHAFAVVVPTLAEGGGSFPAWEALRRGIPVVASDIPVMREHMQRIRGDVLWFSPEDPDDLARVLAHLEASYADEKRRFEAMRTTIRERTWAECANDYRALFERAAATR